MEPIRPHHLGIVVAICFGLVQLVWLAAVWSGIGQTLLDFVFALHMIEPVYKVTRFEVLIGVFLVILTTGTGYVGGWMFAFLWNQVSAAPREVNRGQVVRDASAGERV